MPSRYESTTSSLLLTAALAACEQATGPRAPVSVTPATATLAWGDTLRVSADALGAGPSVGGVRWSSSDTTVARVDSAGLVTARGGGTARLTARAGDRVGTSDVTVEARFTALSTGHEQTCGVVPNGTLLCWGARVDSVNGALADRSTPVPAPALVRGAFRGVQVARGYPYFQEGIAGSVVCATRDSGEALCWGRANEGEVGAGGTAFVYGTISPPRPLAAPTRVAGLALGYWHGCALDEAGAALCWGGFAGLGALGGPSGNARCIGGGSSGMPCQTVPAPVSTPVRFAQVAPGAFHSCAVALDARLHCWGSRAAAGAEDGVFQPQPPHAMDGASYRQVSSGYDHACAVTTEGEARCWGVNGNGRLGRGTSDTLGYAAPAPVATSVRFRTVSAGTGYTCALATDRRALCWGLNTWGQLGDGSTTDRLVPTPVLSSRRFVAVSAGDTHVCATTDEGAAFCWGDNRRGQLGNGVTAASSVPVRVVPPR
jgi:hypothetical protein